MNTQVPDAEVNIPFVSMEDEQYLITASDMVAHMKRVETLVNLLERLGEAIANSPYAAMLPADLVNDLRGN